MEDFVIKTTHDEEIKANLHIYWRQENVYISPDYLEGEVVRVLVYEDNYRILLDKSFYVMYGIRFRAEMGKTYTLRFIKEGNTEKLVALEISKTTLSV